jgi:hypothetical protein
MKRKWIFFVAPPAIVIFIAIFGEVVMHLWNWLTPALFGLRQITFWQALGLLALCRILFGGWGGGSNRTNHRGQKGERWARMTPEEREKFRQNMRSRWCEVGAPASETNEPA